METASTQASPVDAILENSRIGGLQLRVAILCGVIAMLDGFDTQSIAFVAPVVGAEWGIEPARFGLIFSAGLLGIMVGQVIIAPLADRIGRRPVILLCTVLFGALSLLTAAANGWFMLLVLRFLTGLGLGGATPNLITLTCEIAPQRLRATMITTMFAGFPLGAAIGGFISSFLIPAFGWQSVFIFGGVVPLLLLFILVPGLPESPQYLFAAQRGRARLDAMLDRIAGTDRPQLPAAPSLDQPGDTPEPVGFRALFAAGLGKITIPLWLAYFNSLLMIYFLMSWLPTIARETGLALNTAIISAVFLNLGGALGGILLGRLSDRFGPFQVLAVGYAVAGLSLALIGFMGANATLLMILAFLAGLCTIGGQTAMNAAATGLYPARARATGLGAALAVGRIGSIIGPWVGGLLLASQWSLETIFSVVALPAVLTVLISILLSRRTIR